MEPLGIRSKHPRGTRTHLQPRPSRFAFFRNLAVDEDVIAVGAYTKEREFRDGEPGSPRGRARSPDSCALLTLTTSAIVQDGVLDGETVMYLPSAYSIELPC